MYVPVYKLTLDTIYLFKVILIFNVILLILYVMLDKNYL